MLQRFDQNPRLSTRAVASEVGASNKTVWSVLKENSLHPYHIQKVHALVPDDYPERAQFSQWILNKIEQSPNFIDKILFSDESAFTREGIFNTRNSHVWHYENPHEIVLRGYQDRFSVNVWAGIIGNKIIGPYLLPNRLSGPIYLTFLRETLPELLEELPVETRVRMWLQHDGAPAHFSNIVRGFLNANYRRRWIGRGGPVSWPPRSPDLNPLDFFLWGRMKTLVYETPVENEMDLVARIEAAAAAIQEELRGVNLLRRSLMSRFELCVRVQGGHIEHLL